MKIKFSIHPLTYVTALIAIVTANFKLYLAFTMLIIIHELGHIISALIFKWKIDKIVILPIGGMTKFNDLINKPLIEEFIIAVSGIIFQLIFYLLFLRSSDTFFYCNIVILIFNLIPIYPLDGSKILNIILNKLVSFKISYLISIYISFIIILILFFYLIIKKDIVLIIILIPLFLGLIKEYKNRKDLLNKFYLERYLYNINYEKIKTIKGINLSKMKRDYKHIFVNNNEYYTEDIILKNKFDKMKKIW